MKRSIFLLTALAASLTLGACSGDDKRTDATAGEAISDMDKAADEGGVKSDAVVIDNNAGPTVTPGGTDTTAQTAPATDTTTR